MANTAKKAPKVKKAAVEAEKARLLALYSAMPENKRELVMGLIDQAARLRCYLDALWKDLQSHGATEQFSQGSAPPYDRERPAARLFTTADKNYQNVMKQLEAMLPAELDTVDELAALRDE